MPEPPRNIFLLEPDAARIRKLMGEVATPLAGIAVVVMETMPDEKRAYIAAALERGAAVVIVYQDKPLRFEYLLKEGDGPAALMFTVQHDGAATLHQHNRIV